MGPYFVIRHCIGMYSVLRYYNIDITNNNNFAGANINIIGGDIDNYLKLANNAIDSTQQRWQRKIGMIQSLTE